MAAELKPNLEAILNDINRFINIDKDRQSYATHFEKLRDEIFAKLRKEENEVFGYLFNGYQLGGSYGDNLKVNKPNEFDLVFHIKFPDHSLVTVEEDDCIHGNVHINLSNVLHKIRNEKQHENRIPTFKRWVDENGYLLVFKLQSYFESCFHKVFESMQYESHVNGRRVHLRYTKEGPAHTVHVTGLNNFKYSVDFVPGILMDERQSVMPTHVGLWEAIPKPLPDADNDQISFRSSFYRQEQKLIDQKNNLKNALRIMKKFRDAHLNMSKMKSYFIKTLFLWKTKKEEGTFYWRKPLWIIIIDMFGEMENSLIRKRLPFFWDDRFNCYERFSNNLFREMLGTVQAAKRTLCQASSEITLPVQRKVYAIFLVNDERLQMTIADIEPVVKDSKTQNADLPTKELPAKEKEKSYCVIM